ncbi:MAG: M23 family metallopeptidase [Candidatus Aminicenantes bacterium]|nr:M23 family metallopeptidase [Candidatus Aminicenantes bacterium]
MRKALKKIIPILLVVLIGGGLWLKLVKFESGKPWVTVEGGEALGPELAFKAGDAKSGLDTIRVEAVQGATTAELWAGSLPAVTHEFEKKIPLRPLPQGLSDGPILIRITAEDRSWNGGNVFVFEKKAVVDTKPPRLTVLGGPHYINQGGTGCVSYSSDEVPASSGIRVGGVEFRGFPLEGSRYIAFYALGAGVPAEVSFQAVAADAIGNKASLAFRPNIKKKSFKKDKISINDKFLADVLPYFKERDASLQGSDVDVFLTVNRDQRRKDAEKIQAVCRETTPKALWSGTFLRLPDSKPMAGYGDVRTYVYNGKEIDTQTHLGVDLASLAQSKVPAANAGKVAFAGDLGIYGGTVILDHGLGLFSLYAHMSRIDVTAGKDVVRGAVLGLTGSTGMAGGDHLHFAMLVQGVFVNPVEWWDAHWIRDNVELKMK